MKMTLSRMAGATDDARFKWIMRGCPAFNLHLNSRVRAEGDSTVATDGPIDLDLHIIVVHCTTFNERIRFGKGLPRTIGYA